MEEKKEDKPEKIIIFVNDEPFLTFSQDDGIVFNKRRHPNYKIEDSVIKFIPEG